MFESLAITIKTGVQGIHKKTIYIKGFEAKIRQKVLKVSLYSE